MDQSENWDWETGKRLIADLDSWKESFAWIEEPHASPDGERIGAIVRDDEGAFSVCVNGTAWDGRFDRIWYPRFAPDNRLSALVQESGEWTVAVDGEPWEERFEFVWNTQFGAKGASIVASAVNGERQYLVVRDGIPWDNGFPFMSQMTASASGGSVAAVVQTIACKERELEKFQKGCFSLAVDGEVRGGTFVNVWDPAFSADGARAAACVRTSLYDYSIAVDGVCWKKSFASVWAPGFGNNGAVTAPVKAGGKWFLARDGEIFWDRGFPQLLDHLYGPDGKKIAAIVSPKFGRWTVAVDGRPWARTFGDLVTDLVFSPDGNRVGCLVRDNGAWAVCVDGAPWQGSWDMAWAPVFSPDGRHAAAKVEKNGLYVILVDGTPLDEKFVSLWDPAFSPDGGKILIRGIPAGEEPGKYYRSVTDVR